MYIFYGRSVRRGNGERRSMGKMHRWWAPLVLTLTAFVAMIGLAPGTALADAIVSDADGLETALAAGGAVTLSEDITASEQLTVDEDVTLDLNGNTLTLSGSEGVGDAKPEIVEQPAALVNNASFTIKNGTIDVTSEAHGIHNTGSLAIENDATVKCSSGVFHDYGVIRNVGGAVSSAGTLESTANNGIITFGGTVNVTGGKISATGNGSNITCSLTIFNRAYSNQSDGATVTISGGELASYGYAASTNNLYSGGDNASNLTITGGTLTSSITAIYWPSAGTLTIGSEGSQDGPTITSTNGSGIELCSGTLNVYGGTINGGTKQGAEDSVPMSEEWVKAYRNNSGSASMGDAITVIARRGSGYVTAPLSATIEGGTFTSGQNYGVRYLDCNLSEDNAQLEQTVAVAITGGDFSGKLASVNAEYVPAEEQAIITGGKFSSDVSGYVPEDYELNEDGTVSEKPTVAVVGDAEYKSLEEALAVAKDGDVIELVADASVSQCLEIAVDNVTLNGNGHTITAAEGVTANSSNLMHLLQVTGKNATIKDVTLLGTNETKHVLNIWCAEAATLEDVTLNHAASPTGAPLVVNNTDVTVRGGFDVITGAGSWYGINLDNKYGETELVFAEDSSISFNDVSGKGLAFIKVENSADPDGTMPTIVPNPSSGITSEDGVNFGVHTHIAGVPENYVAPTVDSEGYSGDTYCTVCDELLSKGEVIPAIEPEESVMFRLYNKWTGEHFYTSSEEERDANVELGWSYEGIGWIAPGKGAEVYRMYNPYVVGGDHHYTMSAEERDALVEAGWEYEGVAWYSADSESGFEVLRQYNPFATTGTHNYTISQNERDNLVDLGWMDEGVAWYAAR